MDKLEKLSEKYGISKIVFETEYQVAINNGHPNKEDALKYIEEKVVKDQKEQLETLKANNINYNFK